MDAESLRKINAWLDCHDMGDTESRDELETLVQGILDANADHLRDSTNMIPPAQPVGTPVTRSEALAISEETMRQAERERTEQLQPSADVVEALGRIRDLAARLTAAGPKAAQVSASETHEIADWIHAVANQIEGSALAAVKPAPSDEFETFSNDHPPASLGLLAPAVPMVPDKPGWWWRIVKGKKIRTHVTVDEFDWLSFHLKGKQVWLMNAEWAGPCLGAPEGKDGEK